MSKPFNITFDISDVVAEFKLNKQQIDQISNATSKAVTLEIYRNWRDAAEKGLSSTRNGYIQGLLMNNVDFTTNSITLVGKLNNMLENGCSAFDMKTGFEKSMKAKRARNGKWYITIPFRFGTPGALGESSAFTNILPNEVYNLVKNFDPQQTEIGGKIRGGQSLKPGDIPEQYQAPKARNSVINTVINKTFDAYTHKSSIYAGIQKSSKTYESASQGSYNSFRRVSVNSDPMSWIHQGLVQRNFSQTALENTDIDVIVDNTVDKTLSEFGI